MIHSFIYVYYPSVVYASHNVVISVLTLLITSLIFSMLIEVLKKVCKYNTFVDKASAYFIQNGKEKLV